jgi:hypothetical protein
MENIDSMRQREAELTNRIAELREEPVDEIDRERIEDLLDHRANIRAEIAAYETAAEEAEEEMVSERW